MKTLDKDQTTEKATLVKDIRDAHTELETAIKAYNTVMATEQAKVKEKLESLNSKIQDAKSWTESAASDMQSYYDEKSEKWQEGQNGQNYSEWKESYEGFDGDEVEIDFPDEIEEPGCDVADELENLPDGP